MPLLNRRGVSPVALAATVQAMTDHEASFDHLAYYRDGVFGDMFYPGPLIAIRLDDIPAADFATYYPNFKTTKLVGGFAAWGAKIGTTITAANLRIMQANGMEIPWHSQSHDDLDNVTQHPEGAAAAFTAEAITAMLASRSANGLWHDSFVQPGTWTGASAYNINSLAKLRALSIRRQFSDNYASSMGYLAEDEGFNDNFSFPRRYRYGASAIAVDAFSIARAQTVVDNLIKYGGSTVCVLHSSSLTGSSGTSMSAADFLTFLTYVQTKRDLGLLDCVTPTALLYARRGTPINVLKDGGFENATAPALPPQWAVAGGAPVTEASPRTGVNAARIVNGSTLEQKLLVTAGRSYRLKGYCKSAVGGAASNLKTRWLHRDAASGTLQDIQNTVVTTDAWLPFEWTFGTQLLGVETLLRFSLTSGTNEALIDDLVLTKC